MKKSLLTAALVAGFAATGAQAQSASTVTLYGIVDGGVQYTQFKGVERINNVDYDFKNSYTGAASGVNNGNRWGLKGSEDLGNGLKAVFTLESGFNIGTGASTQDALFGRQSTVGLQSDVWGLLEIGKQTNIASKYFAGVATPFSTDFGFAGVGSAYTAAGAQRYRNMVMYQTPKFAGFQFGLGYSTSGDNDSSFKNAAGDRTERPAITTGLRYENGPLAAALTYDQQKNQANLGNANEDNNLTKRAWGLAVSYDFEVAKVYVAGGQTHNGLFAINSSLGGDARLNKPVDNANSKDLRFASNYFENGLKINSYSLAVSAPVGANSQVMASWMMADPTSRRDMPAGQELASDTQHVYSLGYTYNLSKRTNLYALASYANGVNFQEDLKATQVVAGLRHRF